MLFLLIYLLINSECWQDDPDKRPDMQQVISVLGQMKLKSSEMLLSEKLFNNDYSKEDNQINDNATEEDGNQIINSATKWIRNAIKNGTVNSISFNDLKEHEPISKGGFGSIMKAFWLKTNSCVVYKRLTNTTAVKHNVLDAFIHELQIHLHLDYSDRIVRCLGVSQGG